MTTELWMEWLYAVSLAEYETGEDFASWWFNLLYQWGPKQGTYFKLEIA